MNAAQRELAEQHYGYAVFLACRFMFRFDDEFVSEALEALCDAAAAYVPDAERPFKPFMRRAVINRLLAHIGSKRRMRDAEFDVAYTERAPFDISELLPDREMADVVRLCWIEDYSMRQAAGILNLKRRRVKYVLKKAKQRLQGIYDGN